MLGFYFQPIFCQEATFNHHFVVVFCILGIRVEFCCAKFGLLCINTYFAIFVLQNMQDMQCTQAKM